MTSRELLLKGWSWNLWVPLTAVAALLAYFGARRFGSPDPRQISRRPAGYYVAGVTVFVLTLVSPLQTLANGYLFSAHMAQHLLLLLVAPALLLMGLRPRPSAAPHSRAVRALKQPLVCWAAGTGAMWLWHTPNLCDAAATHGAVRLLQIASLIVMGGLFWSPILGPDVSRQLSPLAGVVYLFTACLGCTLLGILITFAPVTVCPVFLHPHDSLGLLPLIRNQWGITPALDQQVGGLMMWVPACSIYLCGILGLLARWYSAAEQGRDAVDSDSAAAAKM